MTARHNCVRMSQRRSTIAPQQAGSYGCAFATKCVARRRLVGDVGGYDGSERGGSMTGEVTDTPRSSDRGPQQASFYSCAFATKCVARRRLVGDVGGYDGSERGGSMTGGD